ncbi:MAG: hypothetical protein MUO72_09430 [Bacteroidales bacterium]|nr:hypothetical protein [Bacteroidales bacterium]
MDISIAVLGLGDSLALCNPSDYNMTIGVNDIWRYVKTDVVVCVDNRSAFTPDRLRIINECNPKAFYSQMVIWDVRPDFVKIDIIPGYPDNFCQLETTALHKSYCSPFVAVQIAWKYYHATEIHLFGIDMVNHPHLDSKLCAKIKVHFKHLKTALEAKNCKFVVHGNGILVNI